MRWVNRRDFLLAITAALAFLVVCGEIKAQETNGAEGQPTASEEDELLKDFIRSRVTAIDDIPVVLKTPEGRLPKDHGDWVFEKKTDSYAGRSWARMDYEWEASELVFQPPYWEDTPLERYGQTRHPILQPVLSGVHFFGTFAIIPYKIGVDRPWDEISTLGYYRPGSPTPCVRQRLPWEWDAALLQAGAVTGMGFIIP